ALAVAKQLLDDLQVVSNSAEMIAKMQSDRDYKAQIFKAVLFPFGTFTTSTKQRLFSDWRALFTGNSRQRKYAAKDIAATFAEQAVFQTVNQFVLGYLWHLLGEFYEWAFDLPEDDDEEKQKKWWQRTITGAIIDNIPLILTDPVQEMAIDAVNYAAYELYKWRTGEDISFKKYSKDVGLPLATTEKPPQTAFETFVDNFGALSAPIDVIISTGETTTEIFNDDLSDSQKAFAGIVAAM